MKTKYEKLWEENLKWEYKETLTESRGVNDNAICVIEELEKQLYKIPPIQLKDGIQQIILSNYTIQTNVPFIAHFDKLIITFGSNVKNESGYQYKGTLDHLNDEQKLINVVININLSTPQDHLNHQQLRQSLMHEIQHTYWEWNILMHGPQVIQQDKTRKDNYRNVIQFQTENSYQDFLKALYYTTELDEIEAYSAELYTAIKGDNNINVNNAQELLKDNNFVKTMTNIKNIFVFLQNVKEGKTEQSREFWGEQYAQMLDLSTTPSKSFKILYQRVGLAYKHFVDKFYKVLGKALMEEHRLGVKLITNHDEIEKALKLIDKICR